MKILKLISTEMRYLVKPFLTVEEKVSVSSGDINESTRR